MQKSNVGPKLLLQLNVKVGPDDDTVSDEAFSQVFNKTSLIKDQQRYDAKGRQIGKGKNYSIEFDNCVTVCVYDPNDEVLQIKETLSQISNLDIMKVNFRNQYYINNQQQLTDQQIRPILKKKRPYVSKRIEMRMDIVSYFTILILFVFNVYQILFKRTININFNDDN